VLPHSPHAGEVVLELRQLDLELALRADGVLGEDVEDQLRAVDHARLKRILELPLLHGCELVVDQEDIRAGGRIRVLQLGEPALADVAARVRPRAVLDHRADGLDACGSRELPQLGQLVVRVGTLGENCENEPALGLGARRRVGLVCRHALSMPACNEVSILRTASSSRSSGTVSEIRKYPSPLGP
jgi:hypothetical protein